MWFQLVELYAFSQHFSHRPPMMYKYTGLDLEDPVRASLGLIITFYNLISI
jgi:hypothetical protein